MCVCVCVCMYVCVFRGFISSARALTVIYLYGRVCSVCVYVCMCVCVCVCVCMYVCLEALSPVRVH